MLRIYTDGGCRMKKNIGAWAYVIIDDNGVETRNSSHEYCTTNNRMEMKAVIEALKSTPEGEYIELTTDSQYVYNTFKLNWIQKWKNNNWFTSKNKVKNIDLWIEMEELVNNRNITWRWVKGHSGDEYNNIVDKMATKSMKEALGE